MSYLINGLHLETYNVLYHLYRIMFATEFREASEVDIPPKFCIRHEGHRGGTLLLLEHLLYALHLLASILACSEGN